jgi:ketosteroid isomerase-like protein
MLKLIALAAALMTSACASIPAPHPAEQIAAAERAFAADGLTMGVKGSFLKHSAADAIFLQDGPVNVHADFAAQPDPKPDEKRPPLVWWPSWVGIAKSGDLGISTGPVEVGGVRRGHYFTVWKRQSDGGWKWIYDGGVPATSENEPPATAPAAYLPGADAGSASPAQAMKEVRAAEASFAAEALTDQKAAHLKWLAADGRLYVAPLAPAKGAADFPATLDGYPATLTLGPVMGGEASAAGDLVFTYGKADWAREGEARRGHYVHVWQKRAEGWKLAFSQIVPVPPAP